MSTFRKIIDEVKEVLDGLDVSDYAAFVSLLRKETRFFFAGEGRSGLVAKMIAMRLMHSGKTVYVVGETITPSIRAGDVLIVISGSGQTTLTKHIGQTAFSVGAHVVLVTANKDAHTFDWCSAVLHIPAATKRRLSYEPRTIQPLGNQFDQSAHIILDAAIIDSLSSSQSNNAMQKRHANLE
ncbi:6-phospho 3-hexuloisomerase [Geobacillus sp. PA-3]|uniref:6-phospho-3-hexuloisomerase n=1 Tax=Geobacillus sp. PA-3 TaxID=1699078 RepID=UPI0006E66AD7|nr:6-phospho-3-hexuloisomerase [Geobacillus sp. PA-3]KQB91637.1 6-phospho 3-hexuloisomerase [Geobacillus sp. PA-3]